MTIKQLHLGICALVVICAGMTYGIEPNKILPALFNTPAPSVDLVHFFRAIMGLYLGIALYWIIGTLSPAYWRSATIVNIVVMAGLAIGRTVSIVFDGVPSQLFVIGLFLEIGAMIWGLINLKIYAEADKNQKIHKKHFELSNR
jgi:Domain of unknown function (DUF4345)